MLVAWVVPIGAAGQLHVVAVAPVRLADDAVEDVLPVPQHPDVPFEQREFVRFGHSALP